MIDESEFAAMQVLQAQKTKGVEHTSHTHSNTLILSTLKQEHIDNSHSHVNKKVLDIITPELLDVLKRLSVDENGKLNLDGAVV